MKFLKKFLVNLLVLVVILVLMLLLFPDMIRQAYELLGALFGPVIILLLLVVAALPRSSRQRG